MPSSYKKGDHVKIVGGDKSWQGKTGVIVEKTAASCALDAVKVQLDKSGEKTDWVQKAHMTKVSTPAAKTIVKKSTVSKLKKAASKKIKKAVVKMDLQGIYSTIHFSKMRDAKTYTTLRAKPSGTLVKAICNATSRPTLAELRTFAETHYLRSTSLQSLYTSDTIYGQFNLSLMRELKNHEGAALAEIRKNTVVNTAALLGDVIYCLNQDLPDIVFRGMACPESLISEYRKRKGETIYFYGFTSTSSSRTEAEKFATRKAKECASARATIFKIRLEKGRRRAVADVSSVSEFSSEKEILIACNSGFRIDDVTKREGMCVIALTLCDQASCPGGYPQNPFRDDSEDKKEQDSEETSAAEEEASEEDEGDDYSL